MLFATVTDSETASPTTNWKYLAGNTEESTIQNSEGVPLSLPFYIHNRQQLISFNNKLHLACEGKTDPNHPTRWRAHVARLETDGTWTLLGGDQGIRQSLSDTIDRRISTIYEFSGSLYAAYSENDRLKIARWNSSTNSWTHLTNAANGLQFDSTWSSAWGVFENLRSSTVSEPASFITISGDLFVIFRETNNAASAPTIRHGLIASQFNGTSFSRVDELESLQSDRQLSYFDLTAELNEELFYINDRGGEIRTYKFDGTSISQVSLDATYTNAPVTEGSFHRLLSFYGADNTLISVAFSGTTHYVRSSVDGGETFSTISSLGGLGFVLNGIQYGENGAQSFNGKFYMPSNESISSSNFSLQPFQGHLLRRSSLDTTASWARLGGGSFNTSMDKNVYQSQLYFIDDIPYVLFKQEDFLLSGSSTRYPDGKIYLAWTAP